MRTINSFTFPYIIGLKKKKPSKCKSLPKCMDRRNMDQKMKSFYAVNIYGE